MGAKVIGGDWPPSFDYGLFFNKRKIYNVFSTIFYERGLNE